MATGIVLLLLLILAISHFAVPVVSFALPLSNLDQEDSTSYIQYKRADDRHYRPSLISFLHQQPDGSQLASTRYYRIVFHCNILPGSLYLRFSKLKPFRTVVQNRQDPSTIFAFRSIGAYSRVQIRNHISGRWLCMNSKGKVIQKSNITIDDLACTFRQNSDGPYITLISELNPSRQMTFNTLHLLSMNPVLHHRYIPYMTGDNQLFKSEQCGRFMLDNQIDDSLLNRITDPFARSRH